jgi:hypothetical protein
MTTREKNARAIAAAIVTVLVTVFLAISHHKEQRTKEQFMAYEANRYEMFIQHQSVFKDFRVAVLGIGTVIIAYEVITKLLLKIMPDAHVIPETPEVAEAREDNKKFQDEVDEERF